jgi:hypothetical protein
VLQGVPGAHQEHLGHQAQVADSRIGRQHRAALRELVPLVDHAEREVHAELAPAEQADRAEEIDRRGGVERAGQHLVALPLDHRVVVEPEEDAEPPAAVERHARVLEREAGLGPDGGREPLAVEAVGARRPARARQGTRGRHGRQPDPPDPHRGH